MGRTKVAVAQTFHVNYDVSGNIQRAVGAVKEAADAGAQLLLLPELVSTGYLFSTELWEMAEVLQNGPTVSAMTKVAKECNILVGFTILEATESGDFFNTFVLIDPNSTNSDGSDKKQKLHICRKSQPAALEAWIFKGDSSMSPIFDTSLGKIAVSICYENMLVSQQERLLSESGCNTSSSSSSPPKKIPFDMLLCPHSAPTPDECATFSKTDGTTLNRIVEQTPKRLASLYGIPVLLSNKIGPLQSSNPFPWSWFLVPTKHTFHGYSSICAGDGFWLIAAANSKYKEVLSANVFLGEDNRKLEKVQTDLSKHKDTKSRYLVDLPSPLPFVWTYIMEPMGRMSYTLARPSRVKAARRAVERGSEPSSYKGGSGGSTCGGLMVLVGGSACLGVAWYLSNQKK